MKTNYQETIQKITASHKFKEDTLTMLMDTNDERRYSMKKTYKLVTAVAVSLVLALGLFIVDFERDVTINMLDRIEISEDAISADAYVNIEGVIEEVGSDGLSFLLDNGQWVYVVDETVIGITSPSAAAVENQYFEPTFRVGNMIAGFAVEPDGKSIEAYAIYTNWNWEDPIR